MRRTYHPFINTLLGLVRPIVYSNLWVASAVWALTKASEWMLDSTAPSVALLNAGGTLVVYGFARFFEGPTDGDASSSITSWRMAMPRTTKLSLLLGVVAIIFALYDLGWLPSLYAHYALAAGLSALYPVPFILSRKGGGLRSIPGLKLLIIAVVWAYVVGGIPALMAGEDFWPIFIERLFWTIALTLPFDIRDVELDARSLRTLPQLVGPRNAAYLSNAAIWISYAMAVMIFGLPMYLTFALYLFFATVLLLARPQFGDLYYSLLIEGFPWLLLGFLWLLPYL